MEAFSGSRAILSGPAGGVVGYAVTSYSRTEGHPVIGFDMGGERREWGGSAALFGAGGGRQADRVLLQGPPPTLAATLESTSTSSRPPRPASASRCHSWTSTQWLPEVAPASSSGEPLFLPLFPALAPGWGCP